MEEKENLSIKTIKKNKITIIHRIYKGHKNINIKVNKKIILYSSLICVFLSLCLIILILFLQNQKLNKKIIENELKYNQTEEQTLNHFNYTNNKQENVIIPKQLFHYKDDDMNDINKNKI